MKTLIKTPRILPILVFTIIARSVFSEINCLDSNTYKEHFFMTSLTTPIKDETNHCEFSNKEHGQCVTEGSQEDLILNLQNGFIGTIEIIFFY